MEGEVVASRIQFVNSSAKQRADIRTGETLGMISSHQQGRMAWIVCGYELQIIDTNHSAATCQIKFEDRITCCTEVELFWDQYTPVTLIVVCCGNRIHLVDPVQSRVVRRISLSAISVSTITSVCSIYGDSNKRNLLLLNDSINDFSCPVMVGMQDGMVCAVDVFFPASSRSTNATACRHVKGRKSKSVMMHSAYVMREPGVVAHTQNGNMQDVDDSTSTSSDISSSSGSNSNGNDENTSSREYAMDGNLYDHDRNNADTMVTCIQMIPEINVVAVGYKSGALELWSLVKLCLLANRDLDTPQPVVHCCYLPMPTRTGANTNSGYLWIGQHDELYLMGSERSKMRNDASAARVILFECTVELDRISHAYVHSMQLEKQIYLELMERNTNTKITAIEAIPEYIRDITALPGAHGEQISERIDTTRAAIVWESEHTQKKSIRQVRLELFDLGVWIYAGKPSERLSLKSSSSLYEYPISNLRTSSPILGIWIDPFSVITHSPVSQTERTSHTLAFDIHAITQLSLFAVHFSSPQQTCLNDLIARGDSILPASSDQHEFKHMIQQCVNSGLLDRDTVEKAKLSQFLDLLWENDLTSVITRFVTSKHVNNLNEIEFNLHDTEPVLRWINSCLEQCKSEYTNLMAPFLDGDTRSLEPHIISLSRQHLFDISRRIVSLRIVIEELSARVREGENAKHLRHMNHEAAKRIEFIRVVECFIGHGILPLGLKAINNAELEHVWQKRRAKSRFPDYDLENVSEDMVPKYSSEQIGQKLFVDRMIEEAIADINPRLLQDKGYLKYPMSVKSIVEMFADCNGNEKSMRARHQLVFYFFLDYYLTVPATVETNVLNMYAQQFQIPAGYQKFIQALWFLDAHHQDQNLMQQAICYLCTSETPENPFTDDIIRVMWKSGSVEAALRMCNTCGCNDPCLHISILLSNSIISQAFELQRKHHHKPDVRRKLLFLLFEHAQQKRGLEMHRVFELPLDTFEENCLMSFLDNSDHEDKYDLQFAFFVQRSRYVQAIQTYKEVLQHVQESDDMKQSNRNEKRRQLLDTVLKALPETQRNIALESLRVTMNNMEKEVKETQIRLPMHSSLSRAIIHTGSSVPFVFPPSAKKKSVEETTIRKLNLKTPVKRYAPKSPITRLSAMRSGSRQKPRLFSPQRRRLDETFSVDQQPIPSQLSRDVISAIPKKQSEVLILDSDEEDEDMMQDHIVVPRHSMMDDDYEEEEGEDFQGYEEEEYDDIDSDEEEEEEEEEEDIEEDIESIQQQYRYEEDKFSKSSGDDDEVFEYDHDSDDVDDDI